MAHDPDDYTYMSQCMSEVLRDIGVNEDMVIKERRSWLLRESLTTLGHRLKDIPQTNYIFGSMTEGSTTHGLSSDDDNLICNDTNKAITDLKDCKPGEFNFVIDTKFTPQGYCHLVIMLADMHLNLKVLGRMPHTTPKTFRLEVNDGQEYEQHGPAISVKGLEGYGDQDYVTGAFHCQTLPQSIREWLAEEGKGKWPTKEMKSFAENNGCFLVGVGSKESEGSKMEQFEWRISMCQAERCLMFSLNITQIRCCVLMKMIIKTFIHPDGNSVVSSYMCKTVLFHCIKHSNSNLWQESKLLYCLTLCLSALQYCVLTGNCPHFMINKNNLMEGRITAEFRTSFLNYMHRIKVDFGSSLKVIRYDGFGLRLKDKMQPYSQQTWYYISPIPGCLLRNTGKFIQDFYQMVIFQDHIRLEQNVKRVLHYIRRRVFKLVQFHRVGSSLERIACKYLAMSFSSTLGSLIASCSISSSSTVSLEALQWFDASLDSDVSSSRLKKASAFYSAGDMETTYTIIKDVQNRYNLNTVEPVCRCTMLASHPATKGFDIAANRLNEEGLKHVAAYCVTFLRCEQRCIPTELQYDTYRTTAAEQSLRHLNNEWLDCAIIDSLMYLLFLKYKTCSRLGKHEEQKLALKDLKSVIYTQPNLGHRETALNLVGQIMEEERKLSTALRFFLLSHNIQPEHNAAKLHICKVLAKMINR